MIEKAKHLLLVFITLFITIANAQVQQLIDSLEKQLLVTTDTNKAKLLNDLTWYYRSVSQQKAIEYGNKAVAYSTEINYPKGVAQGYNDLAIIYTDKREYAKSISLLNKSLEIRKQLNDEKGIAAIYNKLGIINQEKGNIKEALKYQFAALRIFEKYKIDFAIGNSYNNIAVLMYNNNNNKKSLEYHKLAIAIREKINDKSGLGASYLNTGNIYLEELNYNKAYDNFSKSVAIMRDFGDKAFIGTALNNLATACQKLNKWDDALKHAQESYLLRKEVNDKKGIASTALNLATTKIHFNQFLDAKKLIDEALQLSIEAQTKPERKSAYGLYAELYEKQGNYKLANEYQKKCIVLNDSIFTEDNNIQMAKMSTEFEVEKKENDNKRLAAENQLKSLEISRKQLYVYLSIIGIILSIVIGFLLYNRSKHKQQKLLSDELLKQEQLRLRAIIITQEQERKRIAEELHDGIGQMFSAVKMNVASLDVLDEDKEHFKKTLALIDDSCNELRGISHTMMPSALSKLGLAPAVKEIVDKINISKKININFSATNFNLRLDDLIEINLYRIIQELLQNILKYADAKNVVVKLKIENQKLIAIVADDGKGFDTTILKTNTGNGWNNINSRIAIINATIHVNSSVGKGTQVKIEKQLV